MSETEFEREAAQLFQNLGLQLGKETLDFFTSESVHKSDWKSVLKRPSPSPPRRRRVTVGDRLKSKNPGGETSIQENEKPHNGSVTHFKKALSTPPHSAASSSGSSRRHRRASEGLKLAGVRSQEKAKSASTEKHPNALHIATSGPASSINSADSGQARPKNGILRYSSSQWSSSATKDPPHSKKPLIINKIQTQAVTHDEPKRNGFPVANSTSRKLESPVDSSNTQVIYTRKPSLKILSVTTTSSSRVRSVKDRSDESSVGSPESVETLMSPERMEKRITPEYVEKRMLPVHAERRTSTEKRKSVEVAAKSAPPQHTKKRWSRESADRRVSPEDDEKPPRLPPKRRPRSYCKPSENSLEFERPRVLNAPRSSIGRNGQTETQSSEPIVSKSTKTAVPSHWIYDRHTSPEPFVGRTKSPVTSSNEKKPNHSIYRLPSEGSGSDVTPSPVERESVSTSVVGELQRSDSVCSSESESGGFNHTYAILEPPGFSYFGNSRASPSPEGDLRWYDSMDNLAISPEDLRREDCTTTSATESEQRKTVLDRSTQFQSPSQLPTVSALATDTIQALSTLMEALTPSTEHLDRLPYLENAPEQPSPEFESTEDDIDSSSISISSGPISPSVSPEVGQPTSSTSTRVTNRPVSITPEVTRPASNKQTRFTGLTIETDLPVTICAEDEEEFFGYCARCKTAVIGIENGLLALDNIYHTECFSCTRCSKSLVGKDFYTFKDEVLCETDHLATLEHCYTCRMQIRDRVLRAFGRSYHPTCFRCSVCGMCLDGVPYTDDDSQKVYCIQDFHMIYAPKCAACNQPITPQPGKARSVRVIAMDKSFHVECYTCEDCGKQLASLASSNSGEKCYPMQGHLLCKGCHTIRTKCLPRTTSL